MIMGAIFVIVGITLIIYFLLNFKRSNKTKIRALYDAHNEDVDVVKLTFQQFMKYYPLNKQAWWVVNNRNYRKAPICDKNININSNEYIKIYYITPEKNIISIRMKTFKDYWKFLQWLKDSIEQAKQERYIKMETETTVAFLEAIQQDIDNIKENANKECNQALDNINLIMERLGHNASS